MHIHSTFSHDVPNLPKNEPQSIVQNTLSEGADYIAITDHDNDNAYRTAEQKCHHWIRSMELEVNDKRIGNPIHLGIHNIKDDSVSDELNYIAKEKKDAYKLVSKALEKNATVIANHPWWAPKGYRVKSARLWKFIEHFSLPVELNEKRSFIENAATHFLALQKNVPIIAASDSHIGAGFPSCTLAKGNSIDSFLKNIREGNTLFVSKSAFIFNQPTMMARYAADVLIAPEGTPLQVEAGYLVKSLVSWLSRSSLQSKPIRKYVAAKLVGSAGFVAGLLYVPSVYTDSLYKLFRMSIARSVSDPQFEETR